jgi:hypothetical protein
MHSDGKPTKGTRRGRWILATIGVVATLVAAWTWTASKESNSLEQLEEAGLYFPGSTILQQGSRDPSAETHAAIFRQLATDGSMEEVVQFYTDELANRAWSTGGGSSGFTIVRERQTCAWHKGDVRFRLSFWRTEDIHQSFPDSPDITVYELRLINTATTSTRHACTMGLGVP